MGSLPEYLTPRSLPMPTGRANNFWYTSRNRDTVFVFVHGIFSDSRNCWLHGKPGENGVFWPDLICQDSRLENPAIFLAGYYTAIESGIYKLADCAREIWEALNRPELKNIPPVLEYPRLVFICHSTGGIVTRYLLERHEEAFRNKSVGLCLIASPSLGSIWANIAILAAWYFNNQLAEQLRVGGDSIDDIHGRFKDLVNERQRRMPGLFGMEACENHLIHLDKLPNKFRKLLPSRGTLVNSISAGQYFGEVKTLAETDHFSTVKPDTMEHPAHLFLVDFYTNFLKIDKGFRRNTIHSNGGIGSRDWINPVDTAPEMDVSPENEQPPPDKAEIITTVSREIELILNLPMLSGWKNLFLRELNTLCPELVAIQDTNLSRLLEQYICRMPIAELVRTVDLSIRKYKSTSSGADPGHWPDIWSRIEKMTGWLVLPAVDVAGLTSVLQSGQGVAPGIVFPVRHPAGAEIVFQYRQKKAARFRYENGIRPASGLPGEVFINRTGGWNNQDKVDSIIGAIWLEVFKSEKRCLNDFDKQRLNSRLITRGKAGEPIYITVMLPDRNCLLFDPEVYSRLKVELPALSVVYIDIAGKDFVIIDSEGELVGALDELFAANRETA